MLTHETCGKHACGALTHGTGGMGYHEHMDAYAHHSQLAEQHRDAGRMKQALSHHEKAKFHRAEAKKIGQPKGITKAQAIKQIVKERNTEHASSVAGGKRSHFSPLYGR